MNYIQEVSLLSKNIILYSIDDLVEMLQVTRRTIYNYIKSEQLKANKVGGRWIITEENFKNFIEGK